MEKVVVTPVLMEQLKNLTHGLELFDDEGRLLGIFTPRKDLEPHISAEELERLAKEPGEFSTAEVLAYLESLECS